MAGSLKDSFEFFVKTVKEKEQWSKEDAIDYMSKVMRDYVFDTGGKVDAKTKWGMSMLFSNSGAKILDGRWKAELKETKEKDANL